jgi:hypothetical protein
MADKTSSPKGGNRACLCKDGKKYSKECCEGELIQQGIGSLVQQGTSVIINTNTERVIN